MIGIIPWGAYEQHGPVLPLNTDTIIASEFANMIREKLKQVDVLPAIPYGVSVEHAGIEGTVYIDYKTALIMLESLLLSISKSKKYSLVIILNGHGGNQNISSAVCQNLNYTTEGTRFITLHVFPDRARREAEKLFGEFSAHADSVESSVIASLTGNYNNVERIHLSDFNTKKALSHIMKLYPVKKISECGIISKTEQVEFDYKKGSEMVKICVEELIEQIKSYYRTVKEIQGVY